MAHSIDLTRQPILKGCEFFPDLDDCQAMAEVHQKALQAHGAIWSLSRAWRARGVPEALASDGFGAFSESRRASPSPLICEVCHGLLVSQGAGIRVCRL